MIEKSDLDEIVGRDIFGITINPGSVSLSFSGSGGDGEWILIQCRFVLHVAKEVASGNVMIPESAAPLLRCLKKNVMDAQFAESKGLTLFFKDKQCVQLIPEKDGLESYVLHTKKGIVLVIDF